MRSNTTNEQYKCDSLGKITWVRYEHLIQDKTSDIISVVQDSYIVKPSQIERKLVCLFDLIL